MEKIWQRIESWLDQNAPRIKASLLPGASDNDFRMIENKMGVKLPQDMIDFYKIHDGQMPYAEKLIDGEELLSLDRIFTKWNNRNNLFAKGYFRKDNGQLDENMAKKIKTGWWNPRWIPITSDNLENNCSLDLDPAEEGDYEQIIRIWYDDGSREIISPSFREWMTEYTNKLENGKLVYSEEYGGIIDKEFL